MSLVSQDKKRVLVIIWDGLRPDFVRSDLTPNLCQMGTDGVVFERHHAVFPSETRVNSSSLATGCYPGSHGITGNQVYVPQVSSNQTLNTGDHEALQAIEKVEGVLSVPTLCDRLAERGMRFAIASSGSPGSSWLQCPSKEGLMVNVRGVVKPENLVENFGPFPGESIPATERNDRVVEIIIQSFLPQGYDVMMGWFCDPDTTQHKVGLGADLALKSIRENDTRLGALLSAAKAHGVDVLVGSDHGFSTLSEPASLSALLKSVGVAENEVVHTSGSIWLHPNAKEKGPQIVEALFDLPWVGPIFTRGVEGDFPNGLPGTFSFESGLIQHATRTPDVMFSHAWTDEKNKFGIPGMALGSSGVASHGTCSPYDMHNVLIASGPSFLSGHKSSVPSGLIDIAPTIFYLMTEKNMPHVDGRVLREALVGASQPGQSKQNVYSAKRQGRTQYLEILEVDNTRYMEKGWVERR